MNARMNAVQRLEMEMKLDPHCSTCIHGKLLKIKTEMGSMLFCKEVQTPCAIERSGTGFGKCGESAKYYKAQGT